MVQQVTLQEEAHITIVLRSDNEAGFERKNNQSITPLNKY